MYPDGDESLAMYYYKTLIKYEGTEYTGFQWQSGLRTVQSEINYSLAKLIKGKVTTRAASRTDTGVHALGQVVKISSEDPVDCTSFLKQFNAALPETIRCFHISPCSGEFNPGPEAVSKEYRYFFTNKTQISKEENRFVANIANKLDLESMKVCIRDLKGPHDFSNFYSRGSNVKSTERIIHTCELKEINPQTVFIDTELFKIPQHLNHCYELRIEANGFLKQMIRHIVSGLWMVGSGKISPADFKILLDGQKSEKQLWKVAPPNGLFLYKINYSGEKE